MTAAEQLKARMRLLMARADKQNAAAAAATAEDGGAAGAAGGGSAAWTRFVLDKHGALDEDKQAMQQLLDEQVGQAGFAGGNSADAADSEVGVAFIMGTGRAAARKAAVRSAAEQAHEDAIFGGHGRAAAAPGSQQLQDRPVWERQEQQQEQEQQQQQTAGNDAAAALGIQESLLQPNLSWRERALAKHQQQQ
jgi:hypothetical protein